MNHACPLCGTATTKAGRCRDCARPQNQQKNQRNTYSQVYNTTRWRTLRAAVLQRDGYRCTTCGTYPANHAGHIRPFRDGDDPNAWLITNITCQCARCNGREANLRRHAPTPTA